MLCWAGLRCVRGLRNTCRIPVQSCASLICSGGNCLPLSLLPPRLAFVGVASYNKFTKPTHVYVHASYAYRRLQKPAFEGRNKLGRYMKITPARTSQPVVLFPPFQCTKYLSYGGYCKLVKNIHNESALLCFLCTTF